MMKSKVSMLMALLMVFAVVSAAAMGDKEGGAAAASAVARDEAAIAKELATKMDFNTPVFVDKAVKVAELPSLEWYTSKGAVFGSTRAKQGGTYRSFLGEFPQTFRVVGPNGNGSFRGHLLTNLSMIDVNSETKEWMPAAATHWAFDKNGKTVYYLLNKNMKWSDGVPVTADDYVFVLDYMRSTNIQDPWYNTYYTEQITEVKKVNTHCVAVTYRVEMDPDQLLLYTSLSPKPKHFYPQGIPADFVESYNWKAEPTTGPYYLESYVKGESVRFKKVANWWGHALLQNKYRYNPEFLEYKVITGGNDITREYFYKGELDNFYQIIPQEWAEGGNAQRFTQGYIDRYYSFYVPMQGMQGIFFNTQYPLFSDKNVRVGMYYAVNIQKMIDTTLRGEYARNHNMAIGHVFAGINFDDDSIRKPNFDAKKAGEYFDKAGYSIIGADGIRQNAKGQKLSFEMLYQSPNHTERLTVLREEAKLAGVDMQLKMMQSGMFTVVLEKKHQAAWFGMGTSLISDYYQFFHSSNVKPQTNNFFMWSSPAMDALVEGFRAESSLAKKAEITKKIQKIVHDEALFIPHYYVPYYRGAAWKWVRYPAWMNNRFQEDFFDLYLDAGYGWIDEEIRKEVQAAMAAGMTFEPRVYIVDTYKID